jgi:hypothetical protein
VDERKCYAIGDTVAIRGKIIANMNGGTYFELYDKLCVRYPRATDRAPQTNLTISGPKLPAAQYLELTGKLMDLFPLGLFGVGMANPAFKDVDGEVKAEIESARHTCEAWQDANSAALVKRTLGGNVVKEPQNMRGTDWAGTCSVWSVDTQLPHELVTVRMPKSHDSQDRVLHDSLRARRPGTTRRCSRDGG